MTKYEIRDNESLDKALKRFKSRLRRDGVLDEMRKREFYEKPSSQRRKQLEQARRREKTRQSRED